MRFASLLLTVVVLAAPSLRAQEDALVYEGYLEHMGTAVSGTRDMSFALFDVPVGGAAFWSEALLAVPVSAGAFAVVLGDVNPILPEVLEGGAYLEVTVEGATLGRQELFRVPYAAIAQKANSVAWSDLTDRPATFGCPGNTSPHGGWCIDKNARYGAATAVETCGAAGLFVCPAQAIRYCDVAGDPAGAGACEGCGCRADSNGTIIYVGDVADGANALCWASSSVAGGDSISECTPGGGQIYYCCAAR